MNKFTTPGANIMAVIDEIGENFIDGTVGNVRELVDHNEAGVALDILCSKIFEYGIKLSACNKSRLEMAACLMEIYLEDLDGLGNSPSVLYPDSSY
jgi:hypothetical protein